MPTPIAMLCAWCGAEMRKGPLVRERASHGICNACFEKFRSDSQRAQQEPDPPR